MKRRPLLYIAKTLGWIAILMFACGLGAIIAGMLTSCTDTCKDCTTTIYYNNKVQSTTVQNLCGDEWESVDGHVITSKSGTVTVISKTYCK